MVPNLTLGPALPPESVRWVERTLQLEHFKWDTQVGDVRVISAQPLLISEGEWRWLCARAEEATRELLAMEREIAECPELQKYVGVPRALRRLLSGCRSNQGFRTFRFDFHPTAIGWVMSEVNSDVPGGFGEASALPELFKQFVGDVTAPTSPVEIWGCTAASELEEGAVAVLHAPGYLEDQQVAFVLGRELRRKGFRTHVIQSPEALDWSTDGVATLAGLPGERLSGVIRFYQAEWLAKFPRKSGWRELFMHDGFTRVCNPAYSVISESKRLPLSFPFLQSTAHMLSELSPKCIEPIEAAGYSREDWVLKAAYANTGDAVHIGADLSSGAWNDLLGRARRRPTDWVVQQRFETLAFESEHGQVHPCVGVFVIGGQAAGAYVRLSRNQVTDGDAMEAPLLIVAEGSSR